LWAERPSEGEINLAGEIKGMSPNRGAQRGEIWCAHNCRGARD